MALVLAGAAIFGLGGLVLGSFFGKNDTSTQINKMEQIFTNNITNVNNSKCEISNVNIATGTKIIFNNSNIGGDVYGVTQALEAQSTCLLASSMSTNITTALKAISAQNLKIDSGGFLSPSTDANVNSDLIQECINNISNINNQMCAMNNVNDVSDTFIFVNDSKIGGNFVGVSQTSNPISSCSIKNTMKNVVFQQAHGQSDQKSKTSGILSMIVMVIIIVIILLIVIGITMAMIKSSKSSKEAKIPQNTSAPLQNTSSPLQNTSSSKNSTKLNLLKGFLNPEGVQTEELLSLLAAV